MLVLLFLAFLIDTASYYAFLLIPIGIVAWAVYDYRKSK
jgi:hypothetical protein